MKTTSTIAIDGPVASGKTSVGIEIPNLKREAVLLGDLIDDDYFKNSDEGLTLALGKNILVMEVMEFLRHGTFVI